MVIVKIISGPRVGQQNLRPMKPQDLIVPAQAGWRWRVDWSSVPADEQIEWVRHDLVNKIMSGLVRGAAIEFQNQSWQARDVADVARLCGEIEDAIVMSGFNVYVDRDDKDRVVIDTLGTEHRVQ